MGFSEECGFDVMYVGRGIVCNFAVISAVEVFVDCGDVYVFHVCFDCLLFMVLGLGLVLMSVA